MTLLGIVLFVAAVVPTDALITSFVSQLLHLCLGIGAYLLPFFLVAIGASCLVRIDKEGIPLRASVGSAMLNPPMRAVRRGAFPVGAVHA